MLPNEPNSILTFETLNILSPNAVGAAPYRALNDF